MAAAIRALGLSAELQQSQSRLLVAREEERRRLRRDLHDGLGPTLTGMALAADAGANFLDEDPARTRELLGSLRRDSRSALADVRRLVDNLTPPALDELGLLGALERRAEQLRGRSDGTSLDVRLVVPDELPALPAEVEVAAYRIATEALLNIARHAIATSAVIEVRCNGSLDVVVTDDGAGARRVVARRRARVDARAGRRGRRQLRGRPLQTWRPGLRVHPRGRVVTIRVVVADDHPIVRAGLTALLGSIPDFEVAGVAANGREAIREVLLTKPDVALLDLNMPELDGIAATRELARVAPRVAVLVLTMHEDDEAVFAAMRAGARGYLVKGVEQDDIARAIRSVAAGEAIFGPGVAQRVLASLQAPPARHRVSRADRARARDPRPAGGRPEQRRDRQPDRGRAEDGGEQRLVDLHQAAGRRPGPGHRACPRCRPGTRLRP